MMPFVRIVIARLRGVFGRRNDPNFDAEIQDHLRLLTERYVRQGMTLDHAALAARRQFGNMTLLREQRGDMQTIPTLESLWSDCGHAGRMLRKNPTFTAAVVLTSRSGLA
jgi:macrolide transport system ATP-binding/permease protein